MTKIQRDYLRIYANFGKQIYEESEKESLAKAFIDIAWGFCGGSELRFDLYGEGYGISKSSPYITAKTFWGKLEKKGYKKFTGMTADAKDGSYQSKFSLLLQPHNFYRLDADFFWQNGGEYDGKKALKIVSSLLDLLDIGYAYGYKADETLSSGEWVREISPHGSISLYRSKEQEVFAQNIGQILHGAIKKLYEFNVFNEEQIKNLDISGRKVNKISLSPKLECWQIRE